MMGFVFFGEKDATGSSFSNFLTLSASVSFSQVEDDWIYAKRNPNPALPPPVATKSFGALLIHFPVIIIITSQH